MNIIEIGANNGSHTKWFSKKSNVWCFEPNPNYANLLNFNFLNNKNVNIIQKAVSDFDGIATFNIASDGASSSLNELTEFAINNTKIKYVDKIIVDVIRMDTFLLQNSITKIDYLHCDAQGDDFKILKSFGNMLYILEKGKVEVSLKNELYLNTLNYINDVADFLNDFGFDIINWREINMNKKDIYRYDGNLQFCKKNNKQLI